MFLQQLPQDTPVWLYPDFMSRTWALVAAILRGLRGWCPGRWAGCGTSRFSKGCFGEGTWKTPCFPSGVCFQTRWELLKCASVSPSCTFICCFLSPEICWGAFCRDFKGQEIVCVLDLVPVFSSGFYCSRFPDEETEVQGGVNSEAGIQPQACCFPNTSHLCSSAQTL